jgi:hypothetical protein
LKEVAHGMDTQCNESFNNTASWLAPKNKVYCGSQSLHNRLSIALGINVLGFVGYFKRPFKLLGIAFTPDVQYYLQSKESTRKKRLDKLRLKDTKKNRLKKKYDQLKADEVIAKRERSKRDGTYQKGIAMAGTSDEQGSQKRPRNKSRAGMVCPHCGKKGHTTIRSANCLHYVPKAAAQQQVVTAPMEHEVLAPEDHADDLDAFDALPLLDPGDSNDMDKEQEGVSGVL